MPAHRPYLTIWRHPAFWPYVAVVVLWIVSLRVHDERRFLTRDVALLTLLAAVLWSFAAVRSLFCKMPPLHRLGLAAFFALFLLGHFCNKGRTTFPFVSWRMFGSNPNAKKSVDHVEVHGITADNRTVVINPERLFPSLGLGTTRLYMMLHSRTRSALKAEKQQPIDVEKTRDYNDLLVAIGTAYNRNAETRAEHLEVVRVRAFLDRNKPPEAETIWKVKLP